jgi:hypothetical protein
VQVYRLGLCKPPITPLTVGKAAADAFQLFCSAVGATFGLVQNEELKQWRFPGAFGSLQSSSKL